MKTIGQTLREMRKKQGLLLREAGAALSIDPTVLSKIERNERMPTKKQVQALAGLYRDQKDKVMVAWLSDKLVCEIQNDELALDAIKVAEKKILYKRKNERT